MLLTKFVVSSCFTAVPVVFCCTGTEQCAVVCSRLAGFRGLVRVCDDEEFREKGVIRPVVRMQQQQQKQQQQKQHKQHQHQHHQPQPHTTTQRQASSTTVPASPQVRANQAAAATGCASRSCCSSKLKQQQLPRQLLLQQWRSSRHLAA